MSLETMAPNTPPGGKLKKLSGHFPNAYMLFSAWKDEQIRQQHGDSNVAAAAVAKMVLQHWNNMTDDQRAPWYEESRCYTACRSHEDLKRMEASSWGPPLPVDDGRKYMHPTQTPVLAFVQESDFDDEQEDEQQLQPQQLHNGWGTAADLSPKQVQGFPMTLEDLGHPHHMGEFGYDEAFRLSQQSPQDFGQVAPHHHHHQDDQQQEWGNHHQIPEPTMYTPPDNTTGMMEEDELFADPDRKRSPTTTPNDTNNNNDNTGDGNDDDDDDVNSSMFDGDDYEWDPIPLSAAPDGTQDDVSGNNCAGGTIAFEEQDPVTPSRDTPWEDDCTMLPYRSSMPSLRIPVMEQAPPMVLTPRSNSDGMLSHYGMMNANEMMMMTAMGGGNGYSTIDGNPVHNPANDDFYNQGYYY